MPESQIDYASLLQRALRSVVQAVLARVAAEGLPGDHHFYLTLRMDAAGVEAPPFLRQRYPEEMTVVLQHQFQDLNVDGAGFAVTLRFDGMPARLVAPWEAVVAFFDPTAEFGLRFDVVELAGKGGRATRTARPTAVAAPTDPGAETPDRGRNGGETQGEGVRHAEPGEPAPASSPTAEPAAPERPAADGENGKVLSFGRPRDRRGED